MQTAAVKKKASQPKAKSTLSHERILEKALEIIDREGVDGLTMRKLGEELGVEAMAIYYYFPTKTELVENIAVDLLYRNVPLRDIEDPDWRGQVRTYAMGIFHMVRAHPLAVPLIWTALPKDYPRKELFEWLTTMWRRLGFSEKGAIQAEMALRAYVWGATLWESKEPIVLRKRGAPAPSRKAAPAADWKDSVRVFQFGLERLLDGLEVMLKRGETEAP